MEDKIYRNFAEVYDALTDDVAYDRTFSYLEEIFKRQMTFKPHLMLELACGTGNMTKRFLKHGYDMIALDASADMLNVAREKCGEEVLLLNQDMTEFELYGTVDAICCMLDSVNYIQSPKELLQMFRLCENYLEYGGLLVFDINSVYKLKNIIGTETFIRETEDVFSVWENEQDDPFAHFILNFFVTKDGGKTYTRFYEEHTERMYEADEIVSLLKQAGFTNVCVFGEDTFDAPKTNEERIFFTANKRTAVEIK